jgi:hypothetical protein
LATPAFGQNDVELGARGGGGHQASRSPSAASWSVSGGCSLSGSRWRIANRMRLVDGAGAAMASTSMHPTAAPDRGDGQVSASGVCQAMSL